MPEKMPMVGWYDPPQLIRTGIRVAVSTAFGHFADKRETMAAANAVAPQPFDASFDYSARENGDGLWFDYIADTGDGWNPTYAIARLVSLNTLTVDHDNGKRELPRGRILLLGGDQVYPTASQDEYRHRFLHPYKKACALNGLPLEGDEGPRSDLYAIPGNHDWYDGLATFFGLFCRRRIALKDVLSVARNGNRIAGWQTQQTRSYFALKLPGDWWLWATDSQLEGYIDEPQVEFFQHVARVWMQAQSKLILCVAEPSWVYVDPEPDPHERRFNRAEKKFKSFAFLERLAGLAGKNHQLKLVLTGDSHHYARYTEDDRHYIVCGGGGAFLHPTHHLQDQSFNYSYPKPGQPNPGPGQAGAGSNRHFRLQKLFPDRNQSRRLTYRNLAFAALNWRFTFTLFAAYAIFNWLLDFNAKAMWHQSLAAALNQENWRETLWAYRELLLASPWPVMLIAAATGGYYYFADAPTTGWRLLMGGLHAAAQITIGILTICLVVGSLPLSWGDFWPVAVGTVASAIVSATVFGCYLLISLNGFGRHANEAFSSLRIQHHKSFLRIHFAAKGKLTIYPIGLDRVPNDRRGSSADPTPHARLIDDPIEIM